MNVSKEAMKDMYLRMKRIREFETKAQSMFADGKIQIGRAACRERV